MTDSIVPRSRLATQLVFLASGFTASSWAPLIPYAKDRLSADKKTMGQLLLCVGMGAIISMTFVSSLCAKVGCKKVIVITSIMTGIGLSVLILAPQKMLLAGLLLLFGILFGSLDVAMNIHAVEVERLSKTSLMSGFHGMFSVGDFMGSAFVSLVLSFGGPPILATILSGTIVAIIVAIATPRLLNDSWTGEKIETTQKFIFPHGVVLLMAGLTFILFLVEGAMLDWSALYLTERNLVETSRSGFAFMAFSIAMTIGRLCGDTIIEKIGDTYSLVGGSLTAIVGFLVILLPKIFIIVLLGFCILGLGLSVTVPIIFSLVGKQEVMPSNQAITTVTSVGYAGVLAGPAFIGLVANSTNLSVSFWILLGLLCVVPACGKFVIDRVRLLSSPSHNEDMEFEIE